MEILALISALAVTAALLYGVFVIYPIYYDTVGRVVQLSVTAGILLFLWMTYAKGKAKHDFERMFATVAFIVFISCVGFYNSSQQPQTQNQLPSGNAEKGIPY